MYPKKISNLIQNNRFSEAIDKLIHYLNNKNHYDIAAWCDLGYCFLNIGKFFDAIRYLKAALMLSEENGEDDFLSIIYLNLAQAYKYNLDYKNSKTTINKFFETINNNENDPNYKQALILKEELEKS